MLVGNTKFWMLQAMTTYGGSFVKNLAAAWQCADYLNSEKLEKAFPEITEKYIEMGKHVQSLEKKKEEE